MGHRQPQSRSRLIIAGKSSVRLFHRNVDRLGDEAQGCVSHQRPGQQVRLAQGLKSVADAEQGAACRGVALNRLHDRAEPCDGARAKVVAVAEPARQNDNVGPSEISLAMPHEVGFGSIARRCAQRIEVAVATPEIVRLLPEASVLLHVDQIIFGDRVGEELVAHESGRGLGLIARPGLPGRARWHAQPVLLPPLQNPSALRACSTA